MTQEEQEIHNKITARIKELTAEDKAIDQCRGKGISIEKDREISDMQKQIESELVKLKSDLPKNL